MITFCTCWYIVKSKFDISTYKKWMANILNHVNHFNLVIYTNKESYYVIEPFIKSNKLKVIFKDWEEFYTYKWKDEWINNHNKNKLLNHTHWKLNMLWNEKIFFVNDAIQNNYFDTDWYGWCDIGYFRNSTTENWPSQSVSLNKDKIYYGLVSNVLNNLSTIILNKNENNMPYIPIPNNQVSIAGGFFISHKSTFQWWKDTYYNRLNDYFINDYLVKDDQIIIIDCIINNFNRFELIEESDPRKNKWFVFHNI